MLNTFPTKFVARYGFLILSILWILSGIFGYSSGKLSAIFFTISIVFASGTYHDKSIISLEGTFQNGLLSIISIAIILINFTFLLWSMGYGDDVSSFSGAIFVSWTANLVFFVFLGLMGILVSLSRPEKLPFENRARIFLGGRRGAHIDYHIEELREHARFYGESASISIELQEFNKAHQLFLVKEEFKTSVRSFVTDTSKSYRVICKYAKLTPPPPGRDPARVSFVSPTQGPSPHPAVTANAEGEIFAEYLVQTTPNNSTLINYILSCWIANATEPNNQRLVRFTLNFRFTIRNITGIPVRIKFLNTIEGSGIKENSEKHLADGESFYYDISNIRPGVIVYSLAYEALDESGADIQCKRA